MSIQSTAIGVTSVAAGVLSSVTTNASVSNPVRLTMRASAATVYIGPTGSVTSASYRVSTAFPFDLTVSRASDISAITSAAATTATLWVIAAK